jgi:hypothetical protein
MKRQITYSFLHRLLPAVAALFITAGPASAADFYLVAEEYAKTLPGGEVVTMWGYKQANASFTSFDDLSSPGPTLIVPPGDTELRIHLMNGLEVPTSLVIPGLNTELFPVRAPNGRVVSFTTETAPGDTTTYSWTAKPGSYIYQSGTHVAVQIQMGLVGAAKQNAAPGVAYGGDANVDSTFANEVDLVYTEIDPGLHAAVADGSYGTPAFPSTVDYRPKYFLINGEPWPNLTSGLGPATAAVAVTDNPTQGAGLVTLTATADEIEGGGQGDVLVRFYNASLQTHVPVFNGISPRAIGEDGNRYAYSMHQNAILLAAGKTKEAILDDPTVDTVRVYDRRLFLTNGSTVTGGMLVEVNLSGSDSLITGAEYFVGADPGVGNGIPMDAVDGAFDSSHEELTVEVDISDPGAWPAGSYPVFYVRSVDGLGNWGVAMPTVLHVSEAGFVDSVVVVSATYADGDLSVTAATSALPGTAGLEVDGLGILAYNASTNLYEATFEGVADPGAILVTSSLGGSDARPVPWPMSPSPLGADEELEGADLMAKLVILRTINQPTRSRFVVEVAAVNLPAGVLPYAVGWGVLDDYDPATNIYRGTFQYSGEIPDSVAVTVDGGEILDEKEIPYPAFTKAKRIHKSLKKGLIRMPSAVNELRKQPHLRKTR